KTIYVDDDAAGAKDGMSWTDAYIYLQDALADANEMEKPIEIRVAQGIYKPDQGINQTLGDRVATFQLVNSVRLIGGFAGVGEPDPDARDVDLYETILSGDLDDDDIMIADPCALGTEPTRAENSYHVVTGSGTDGTAIIDGFILTAGHSNGPWPHVRGGAVHNVSGNPTFNNCLITGNWAIRRGGGMYNYNSSPILTDCTFTGNSAEIYGGGMLNGASSPTLTNCSFIDNKAIEQGGGLYNRASSPVVTNCIFTENWAGFGGGGIENFSESTAVITNCTFSGNIAEDQGGGMHNNNASPVVTHCLFSGNSAFGGAGMVNFYNSTAVITNCIFSDNVAEDHGGGMNNCNASPIVMNCLFMGNQAVWGGGMQNSYHSTTTIARCIFSVNTAEDQGGGVFNNNAAPVVTRCLFSGNSALGGGGMSNFYYSAPAVTNCTFGYNTVAGEGSGINSYWHSAPVVTNCILWSNLSLLGPIISCAPDSSTTVSYSNVEGGWPGQGNIDADPFFAYPGYWVDVNDPNIVVELDEPNAVWVDGDYHLKSQAGRWDPNSNTWVIDDVTSPCIDAGDPNDYVAFEPIPNGSIINMGTHGGTLEASISLSGPVSGTSQYVFLPALSTLVQTGGIAAVNWAYTVEGQFKLVVDLNARTAMFSQVDTIATDDGPPVRELDLNQEFSLDSIVGSIADDGTIEFYGKAVNDSDIVLSLTFSDDLVHLVAKTIPPDESADFFIFNLDAFAQRKDSDSTEEPQ
ncbi:hypothetical protein ACFL3F_03325, partial [Planctomycetota bacterium]